MTNRRILIAGAGIAGPAAAHWLVAQGAEVTVVERSPALRTGGQAVDFRGPVHRAVLERMGLWGPIHEHQTSPTDLVLVGGDGAPIATLPAVMTAGDVEILRGDLVRLLHDRSNRSATYRFGDHPIALAQDDQGVDVRFASGREDRFDLVIGADGLHSGVRALAFGPEARFVRHHGYRLATWAMPNLPEAERRTVMYTEPGRALTVQSGAGGRGRAQLVFAGAPLSADERRDAVPMLRARYAGAGWCAARVLQTLDDAPDLYVDEIGTVVVDRYAAGRVVLLGDAAWGGTLGGQGTGLGIVGAYVLAGELASAQGDHAAAFARFERRMRPYATDCQKGAERAGSFFAPRTRFGLACRNAFYRAFTSRLLIGQFEKMVKASAGGFELPAYAA